MQSPASQPPCSKALVCLHMIPALMAVGYPGYLAMFYQFRLSEHIAEALLSLGLVFAVPGSAFVSLYALGRTPAMRSEGVVLRRVAYLAFASPSLFVIVGVFLYLMKIDGKDKTIRSLSDPLFNGNLTMVAGILGQRDGSHLRTVHVTIRRDRRSQGRRRAYKNQIGTV